MLNFLIRRFMKEADTRLIDEETISNLARTIIRDNLTYLPIEALLNIANTVVAIENNNIEGIFIEAGCALGGSTVLISKIKSDARCLMVYDVFGMIPAPTTSDTEDVHERYNVILNGSSPGIGGEEYYGYRKDLFAQVISNLRKYRVDPPKKNVSLIKGLLQETLRPTEAIAFAHIDVDWYEPVKVSLERIFPNLAVGGTIIIDDYFAWGGCRKAVDEFLSAAGTTVEISPIAGRLNITRRTC